MTARYITTPIYYLNGEPHLGHVYTTVAADVLARYWRLAGAEVKFLTGTDEHGQKIAQAAEAAGKEPQQFVDEVSKEWFQMTQTIGSSQDQFIRTTQPDHYKAAQALWKRLEAKGQIYKGAYSGWYSVRDEAYYDKSEITDGKAPSGSPVEWLEEESYFFKLSEWEEPLLRFYGEHPEAILPISRRNEVISFIKGGLRDLSISRSNFSWGVPVPTDPKHVMYVWIEALTNYLTALGYPDTNSKEFQTFWPNVIHLMGKDIIRFHAVYWPAFLMAAGIVPPHRIFAHGWLLHSGEKMSKSLGNVLDPFQLIDDYGLDQVRYFLMREVPFGQDGSYSEETFIHRINSDLANDFGNLSQRVLSFIHKNANAQVPNPGEFTHEDEELLAKANHLHESLRDHMDVQAVTKYCETIWAVISDANRYVDHMQPWSLKKSEDPQDQQRMNTILYVLSEVIRHVATYAQPIIPTGAGKILDQLAQENRDFESLKSPLQAGLELSKPEGVFPRIEVKKAS